MKQLIFHGKKTVPNALRRDMWRPYFAIRFPKTPAGASRGLQVYKDLREMSLRRQLDPPKERTLVTVRNVKIFKGIRGPRQNNAPARGKGRERHLPKIPIIGTRLEPSVLARMLMNQRKTSVVDVAMVLEKRTAITPQEAFAEMERENKRRQGLLSKRGAIRLATIKKEEAKKEEELEARRQYIHATPGRMNADNYALKRLSTEYGGSITFGQDQIMQNKLDLFDEKDVATEAEIGAERALEQALADIEAEKEVVRNNVEKELSVQVEERIAKMTEAERGRIRSEVEKARAGKQEEIDTRVAKAKEELKLEKEQIQDKISKNGRKIDYVRRLRYLTRDRPKEIIQMKADLYRRGYQWIGPYAEIPIKTDQEMAKIDRQHKERIKELRREAEAERERHGDLSNREVEVLWADIRDGTYVESWPETVFHGSLHPKAVVKQNATVIRQHYHLDEDEMPISEQKAQMSIPRSNSVHVFGSDYPDTSQSDNMLRQDYQSPEEAAEARLEARERRIAEWSRTANIMFVRKIADLRIANEALKEQFKDLLTTEGQMPEIASYMRDSIGMAREAFEGDRDQAYEKEVRRQLDWLHENLPLARDELGSLGSTYHKALLDWIENEITMIELEHRHNIPQDEVQLRTEFLANFVRGQALEEQLRKSEGVDEQKFNEAYAELDHFHENFPLIKDARQSITDDLDEANAKIEAIIQGLQQSEEESTNINMAADLKHLETQRTDLQKKLDSVYDLKNDPKVWLAFKRVGDGASLRYADIQSGVYQENYRKERDLDDATVAPKADKKHETRESSKSVPPQKPSLWQRLFGR